MIAQIAGHLTAGLFAKQDKLTEDQVKGAVKAAASILDESAAHVERVIAAAPKPERGTFALAKAHT